ncbi:hypothetical protein E1B28_000447 [Marasmius oreades]|uniref:Uncharacterized protein n=1 Tax=Marasmius oreades TaxID=181124 RepID=A0A9P8AEH0_9AGAR|nr:uncharacterized protein E1B28_000447 [Marasmius oreades]KAG7098503.1 hypothetical protein E1B28_000447 [Marasmius oreades]
MLAYQGIKEIKSNSHRYQEARDRRKTRKNLRRAKKTVKTEPSSKQIWNSLGNKTVSRNIRNFLFVLLHGGYRNGNFWKSIRNEQNARTVENRWTYAIKNRLTIDGLMTDVRKYGKKSFPKRVVKDTWKDVTVELLDNLRTETTPTDSRQAPEKFYTVQIAHQYSNALAGILYVYLERWEKQTSA